MTASLHHITMNGKIMLQTLLSSFIPSFPLDIFNLCFRFYSFFIPCFVLPLFLTKQNLVSTLHCFISFPFLCSAFSLPPNTFIPDKQASCEDASQLQALFPPLYNFFLHSCCDDIGCKSLQKVEEKWCKNCYLPFRSIELLERTLRHLR